MGQMGHMFRREFLMGALAVPLAGCAGRGPRFLGYDGPEVTRVVVHKSLRALELHHFDTVLTRYSVQLGFAPQGHKERLGDGRTPEGEYLVDRRNPRSAFHLSVGIDYPNETDRERARELGVSPGGDIFIHGRGPQNRRARGDWTAGCIAVKDREIEQIYAMVRDGTPITINP